MAAWIKIHLDTSHFTQLTVKLMYGWLLRSLLQYVYSMTLGFEFCTNARCILFKDNDCVSVIFILHI